MDKKLTLKGTSKITFKKYNTTKEDWLVWREFIYPDFNSEQAIGVIEGKIQFTNLPIPCQMPFGYYRDNQICDAAPLIVGLFDFPQLQFVFFYRITCSC